MMSKTNYLSEFRPLIRLALPLVASGIVEFSSGFVGTVLLGHVGAKELAAGTLVNAVFSTILVFLWGILNVVTVLVAQAYGARNKSNIVGVLQSGLLLSLVLSPLVMWILWHGAVLLEISHQKPEIIALAISALHAFILGILPNLINVALLQFVMGLGHVRINLYFNLLMAPLTIGLMILFIFGYWHFPYLSVAGLGWSFTAANWVMLVLFIIYLYFARDYQEYWSLFREKFRWQFITSILKIGVPIGVTYIIDLVYLLILALLMGGFGIANLAAHQIIMQYFWQATIIGFAVGQAISVKIGHYVGEKEYTRLLPVTYVGTVIIIATMLCISLIFWFFPEYLVHLDLGKNPDAAVMFYAIQFFFIAGFVQILQGGWMATLAALRGLGDTRILVLLSILAEYCIGLPFAYIMAYPVGLQGRGIWLALTIDSVIFISLAAWRFHYKVNQLLS